MSFRRAYLASVEQNLKGSVWKCGGLQTGRPEEEGVIDRCRLVRSRRGDVELTFLCEWGHQAEGLTGS